MLTIQRSPTPNFQPESLHFLKPHQKTRLAQALKGDPLARLWACPWKLLENPDPWQAELLVQMVTREENVAVCCSRQIGKTHTVSAGAYMEACLGGFVLVLAPGDEQAMEFLSRVKDHERRLRLVPRASEPTKHELCLQGGGRILALPNNEKTVRCRSAVTLLVLDEAARVPDALYGAVSPMLAVSQGRKALLSTPFGKRGFFHKAFTERKPGWRYHEHPWHECPRLTPDFIESERLEQGELWVQQEYECRFIETGSSLFDPAEFAALIDPDMPTLDWN